MGRSNAAVFPTTDWMLLWDASRKDSATARASVGRILELYLPPMRRFLRYRWNFQLDQIDELLQGFVADRILRAQLFARAHHARGRFRNFLVRALENYVINQHRKDAAYRRRVATADPTDIVSLARSTCSDPAREFERQWAIHVLQRAIEETRSYCLRTKRPHIWEVFRLRLLTDEPQSYGLLAHDFGFASPQRAASSLHAAKRIFSRMLKQVLLQYGIKSSEVDNEIRWLQSIFGNGPA